MKDVLTIFTQPCIGESSMIGRGLGEPGEKMPNMELQRGCDKPGAESNGIPSPGTVVHELGHTLGELYQDQLLWNSMYIDPNLTGLMHEHQRPDRDKYIRYLCENLQPDCKMPKGKTCCDHDIPKECCSGKPDFHKYPFPGAIWTKDYDFDSIMQYAGSAAAIPGTVTLVSKVPGKNVPELEPRVPSQMDYDQICKIYAKECHESRGSR